MEEIKYSEKEIKKIWLEDLANFIVEANKNT